MYVLVLASQKGGSGKTTLSGHLAVEADLAGMGPVALIDCDTQGSLSDWCNSRAAETPHFEMLSAEQMGLALGLENVIHAALTRGAAAQSALARAERLARFMAN